MDIKAVLAIYRRMTTAQRQRFQRYLNAKEYLTKRRKRQERSASTVTK